MTNIRKKLDIVEKRLSIGRHKKPVGSIIWLKNEGGQDVQSHVSSHDLVFHENRKPPVV
jgi:hypothetical protein